MHIPDGFLDTKTWVTLSATSAGVIGVVIVKTRKIADEKHVPLLGIIAAFIFAAQMIKFPVIGGTSGHFMGGALAAILLGPYSAILVITAVLIVQCFIFQDGGVTTLGANVFNMGIIGSFSSYFTYALFRKISFKVSGTKQPVLFNAAFSSWISVVLGAFACAVELAVSGTVPLSTAVPAMVGVNGLAGIGEGIITGLILNFIFKVRPDLLEIEKL